MGKSTIAYNGYPFPVVGTKCTVDETFVYDEAERTVKATRFRLRVQTLITSETPSAVLEDPANNCGLAMQRVRRLLSKPGGSLIIDHEGFADRIEINTLGSPVRDISWGPKPRVLTWEPVGHTCAVEIVWECEFEIPVCDGITSPQFQGVAQFNYAVGFSIDNKGYTTRTISGVIEIALTRLHQKNRRLADTVDAYRSRIIFGKPPDFERTVDWNVSSDKRTANFTIIDRQIQSPNAYPPGVVDIQATHRAGVERGISLQQINNVLSASIELAPNEHKSRAWMIFREMLRQRQSYTSATIFLERLEVVEEIYENRVNFQAAYRFTSAASALAIFTESGMFKPTPLSVSPDAWGEWSNSLPTPFVGTGKDRGVANLAHEWANESIVDLCEYPAYGGGTYPSPGTPDEFPPGSLCNAKPAPDKSWLAYETKFEYRSKAKTTVSVELKPNDLQHLDFSPGNSTTNMPQVSNKAERWVEDQAGVQTLIFTGYAERVGYPIPQPGVIKIGGKRYKPAGAGAFDWKLVGIYFCQPLYAAAWKQQYKLAEPMKDFNPSDTLQGVK